MMRTTSLSVLARRKREVAKAVAALRAEVTRRETELTSLRAELERWQAVLSVGATGGGGRRAPRLDWGRVLAALPATFTPQEVGRRAGKPMAQVYARLSRWAKGKKIHRVTGGYRKGGGGPPPARKSAKRAVPADTKV
jgi:hypothetical protein